MGAETSTVLLNPARIQHLFAGVFTNGLDVAGGENAHHGGPVAHRGGADEYLNWGPSTPGVGDHLIT